MATEIQTAIGDCPVHGEVEATRKIPKTTFPLIITTVQRTLAKHRRRYQCPACGADVSTE